MSAYIPAAAPAPTPAPMVAKKEKLPEDKDTASSTEDLSFMESLMASLMGSNQSFAVAANAEGSREPIQVPVKFGGTFNMDPSMLVLPEGVNANTLVNADGTVSFNKELLTALTPGVPGDAVAVAPGAADPRLIATGLSPAEMTDLMAKLASLTNPSATAVSASANAAITSETPVTTQPSATLAIVSFLPDAAATGSAQPVTPQSAISTQAVATADDAIAQALSLIQPGTDQNGADVDEGFDPVEFRLTVQPSRYGSVSLYATPSATAVAPVVSSAGNSAAGSADTGAAIKGVMQHVSGQDSGPAFTSALSTSASGAANLGDSASDPLLAASGSALVNNPVQLGTVTNPVVQNITAAQSHPATQAVAALIVRQTQTGHSTQTLAVQLDPPELGKLQLKMRYERGEPLKVHVVLEKADTLAMFQRNAHALENALTQAGVQTDGASLTFDLAQGDGAFQQAMGQDGSANQQSGSAWAADGSADVIESKMSPVYTDPKTGLTHYNIYA